MGSTDTRSASFGHLFRERVAATPGGEAFRRPSGTGWQSLTWAQTKDQVYAIAAGLVGLGVEPEQRVAIASSTRLDWILTDLAIACAGAATTTVYPSTAAGDVEYILRDSESVVVVAENADQAAKVIAANLPALTTVVLMDGDGDGDKLLSLAELAERGRALLAERPTLIDERIDALTPASLATLIYTSGTTGRPKGVRLVHDNWTYEGKAVAELDLLHFDDLQYLWLPLSHVFGKVLIAIALQIGFATAVDGDLTKIVENLGQVQPTFMAGAPRVFEKVRATSTDWGVVVPPAFPAAHDREQVGVQQDPRRDGWPHPILHLRLGRPVAGRGRMVRRRRPDHSRGLRHDGDQRGHLREPARRQQNRDGRAAVARHRGDHRGRR